MSILDYALTSLRRAAEHGGAWPVSPGEAAALVAEVERLRENAEARERVMRREEVILRVAQRERDKLLAEVERLRAQRVLDNEEAARLYDFARDKGAALERDATVAYLRAPGTCCSPDVLAENIERGDHRREEKP